MESILVNKAKNQLNFWWMKNVTALMEKKKDFLLFWPAYEANDMEELSLWVFQYYYKKEILHALYF